jgi:hypothetical protein
MSGEVVAYLADEVESDHVTGLSDDGVWRKLELVVGSNRDHHGGSGGSQALGQGREYDVVEEHGEFEVICIRSR